MDFQPRRREDNLHTGFGQTLRPVDVSLFIETRLQLNHHGHFLAVMGGVDHGVDDARVFRHAINIDFNCQHAWVKRRLAQQFQHVLEGVIRIIEQHIALANGIKAVAELIKPDMAQAR